MSELLADIRNGLVVALMVALIYFLGFIHGAKLPRPAPYPPADAQVAPAAPETAPDSQPPSTGERETP